MSVEVKDYTKLAIRAVRKATFEGVIQTAVEVTAQAKDLCPVADYMGGNLKGSIQWQADGGKEGGLENGNKLNVSIPKEGAVVGTPVHYGVYQEFGTRKMNAQPFLRPAIDIIVRGKSLKQSMYRAFFDTVARDLPK